MKVKSLYPIIATNNLKEAIDFNKNTTHRVGTIETKWSQIVTDVLNKKV